MAVVLSAKGLKCPTMLLGDTQVGKATPFSICLPLKLLAHSLHTHSHNVETLNNQNNELEHLAKQAATTPCFDCRHEILPSAGPGGKIKY